MQGFIEFMENKILITAIVAWAISCALKAIICVITQRRLRLSKIFGSGGMPSTHSATVTALAMITGLMEGFDTAMFALSVILAIVVMYDASGIRRAAGQHASFINILMDDVMEKESDDEMVKLKEVLGHTPIEVTAGAITGIIVALVSFMYF